MPRVLLHVLLVPAIVVAVGAVVAGCGASGSVAPAACAGGDLRGDFSVVRGSAGAGQIVYRLRLTNAGADACFVAGLPRVRLLGRDRAPLPTHVIADRTRSGKRVLLSPGASAAATARFSPDVPGVGEPQRGRCEPVAVKLRVTVRGSTVVPVRPPTAVCEHGRLVFRPFVRA